VQRSKSACFAQQKGTSSCYDSVAIFLISLSDKNFEFSNFQIPLPLAWRVSADERGPESDQAWIKDKGGWSPEEDRKDDTCGE
jgi:hypothetical protein